MSEESEEEVMERKESWYYHVAAIIIVAIWGVTFVSTKYLLNSGLSPVEIFIIRFSVAYAGILAVSHKKMFCNSLRDEMLAVLTGLFGGSLYFIVENIALEKSSASNISLIVCTAPVFTLLASSAIRKQGISLRIFAGLAVSMAGVAVLLFRNADGIQFNPAGDFLALAAAVMWAAYSIVLGFLSDRYGSSFITRKTFFYGVVTALPLLPFVHDRFDLAVLAEPYVFANLFFLSVIASLTCYFAWGKVIRRLGSVTACNYLYINPVAAVVASIAFLGERMTVLLLVGMLLVFSGLYLAQKK